MFAHATLILLCIENFLFCIASYSLLCIESQYRCVLNYIIMFHPKFRCSLGKILLRTKKYSVVYFEKRCVLKSVFVNGMCIGYFSGELGVFFVN